MIKKKAVQKIRSKKSNYDGHKFASTLELVMYKLLKELGCQFSYEGKTYEIFESFNLDKDCWERINKSRDIMSNRRVVRKITYTPDFIAKDESWVIECKGRANESFPLRWKLFKKYIQTWDKPPIIFKPTNKKDCLQVIKLLNQYGYGKKQK